MKKFALLLVCFLIVLSGIGVVSAETITGSLGSDELNSTNTILANQPTGSSQVRGLYTDHIEETEGLKSLIRFSKAYLFTFDAAAPSGAQTSVIIRVTNNSYLNHTGVIIGTGTLGYQRKYNGASPPVEQLGGYVYLIVDNYTTENYTGATYLYLDYNSSALYNITAQEVGSPVYSGQVVFAYAGVLHGGFYTQNMVSELFVSYTATKPSGIGIGGNITKIRGNSQVFICNSSGVAIISEMNLNSNNYSFTVPNNQIIIAVRSSLNKWYNSSVLLFGSAIPTPTPTTTIPPGYIVTYFRTFDPLGNSDIHGTDISLYDVEAATWTNYTADADGRGEIYTLPYHTVNAIGHYPTAGIYNDGILTGAETGYYGNSGKLYYLDMYPYTPPPPGGYTNLYTTVREADDKFPVFRASIGITTVSTGAYYGTNSGSTGVSVDTFPNNTALRIVVSKSGYQTATVVTNTGTGATKYVYVDLTRATVTPIVTATSYPGEITTRPTYAPGCDPSAYDAAICSGGKDSDMMNQVRDAGPGLIGLAIIATMLGLVKLMMKK